MHDASFRVRTGLLAHGRRSGDCFAAEAVVTEAPRETLAPGAVIPPV